MLKSPYKFFAQFLRREFGVKWTDYREKLGIGFSDNQKANALANKISSFIESGKMNQNYSRENYFQFCRMVGKKYENIFPAKDCISHLFEANSFSVREIISYYIAFVNSQIDQDEEHHKRLIEVLTIFLDELNIQHEVYHDSDGYFIFPKGIPEFDEELVSKPLYWLKDYPNAENAWGKALRSYAIRGNDSASDVADKF